MEVDALNEVSQLLLAPPTAMSMLGPNFTSLATPGIESDEEPEGIMNRPPIKVFFLLMYIVVFISSLVGNSMVLIVIVSYDRGTVSHS